MKRFIVILSIVVLSGVGIYSVSSNKNVTINRKVESSSTDSGKVIRSIGKGATLIDVRTINEYEADHAVGAINVPLSDIQSGKMPAVAKNSLIYVYCHSGARAENSKSLLKKAGYNNVISLKTLYNWVSMGGKVTGSASICKINRPENC